jgi:hypothetical protein
MLHTTKKEKASTTATCINTLMIAASWAEEPKVSWRIVKEAALQARLTCALAGRASRLLLGYRPCGRKDDQQGDREESQPGQGTDVPSQRRDGQHAAFADVHFADDELVEHLLDVLDRHRALAILLVGEHERRNAVDSRVGYNLFCARACEGMQRW